jgi:hypothetical protein
MEFGREIHQAYDSATAEGSAINEFRFKGNISGTECRGFGGPPSWRGTGGTTGPLKVALKAVRISQFALELKYSWYRPAVIAFATICDRTEAERRPRCRR